MNEPLYIVLRCHQVLIPKVRYVFDTFLMAKGIPVVYSPQPPSTGLWILYSGVKNEICPLDRCITIAHCPESWRLFSGNTDIQGTVNADGLATVFSERVSGLESPTDISFDLIANAFYFLSSWSERFGLNNGQTRSMYSNSIYDRFNIPQDIVDQYLELLIRLLHNLCERLGVEKWKPLVWPQGANYALVLSHDIDFIPANIIDICKQGAKTIVRHLVLQRDPTDALYALAGLANALIRKRDPYGCVPEIIAREKELETHASFQVAVGHRHPNDVNYRIEDDRVRDYLRVILDAGFDLCLHGSYRSTENQAWYVEEAVLLAQRLGKPLGSRQHFLSFNYDALFQAQEQAGILYDMSMGYPDRIGARAGFSYPYFPYCFREDRPYNVLQLNLFLMDVTLRSYLGLKGIKAWEAIKTTLDQLHNKRGCASVVWHPIVFGGARDPGYDRLFWDLVEYTRKIGGFATDGRTVNEFWRTYAKNYASFS